jgi:putative ABC transport system permease protein
MLASYFKLSLKVLARRKFFTFVSLFGSAFTLLVLMLASALFDHLFAGQPPETRAARTLAVYAVRVLRPNSTGTGPGGYALFDKHLRGLPGVERLALVSTPSSVISYSQGARIKSVLRRTDADYFRILDFAFLEGGPFGEADVQEARFVAVINASTRARFFGAGPALGRRLEADGQAFSVVGVVPDVPLYRLLATGDIYVPVTTSKSDEYKHALRGGFLALFLLTDPGAAEGMRQEFKARLARLDLPAQERILAVPESAFASFARVIFGDYEDDDASGKLLAILLASAFAFMLLPAVNLMNLNMSRALERASEIGVRRAFGAAAHDLLLQFLFENVVLALLASLLALGGALGVLTLLEASDLVPHAHFTLNLRIAAWGLAFALIFGVVSGLLPAWRLSRLPPLAALAGGRR